MFCPRCPSRRTASTNERLLDSRLPPCERAPGLWPGRIERPSSAFLTASSLSTSSMSSRTADWTAITDEAAGAPSLLTLLTNLEDDGLLVVGEHSTACGDGPWKL